LAGVAVFVDAAAPLVGAALVGARALLARPSDAPRRLDDI
jgi:hypothetical protein